MLELLYRLLIGHSHKWKIIDEVNCTGGGGNWTRRVCQCEHCGKIKWFDPPWWS
jgi:hypothetical protein